MEDQKYNTLTNRSSDAMAAAESRHLSAAMRDQIRKLEARAIINAEIEDMRSRGEALTLTEEEIKMLESFRRFKLRMRRDGECFTWQTRRPEGVQLAADTAEIVHPNELSSRTVPGATKD
jgi:hypothetical protein